MPEHISPESILASRATSRVSDALRKAAEARFAETRFPADTSGEEFAFDQAPRSIPAD